MWISDLFSGMSKRFRQASEDARMERAVYQATYILDINKVPEGESHPFGDYISIRRGNSSDPTDTASPIEIDYKGKRVLNYSSFGDDLCHVVTRSQMNPDLAWTKALSVRPERT